MSRFTGELTITQLDVDYRTWRLEQPLVYEVGEENSGHVIEVHKLFETDGASIPRLFQSFLPTWGRYSRAAVVHDYLYNELRPGTQPHPEAPTRQRADAIFYEAMEVSGVGFFTRWIMWAAVRTFGFLALQAARAMAWKNDKPMPAEVAPRAELDIVSKRRREAGKLPPQPPSPPPGNGPPPH
ncbi:DUF1353 domain-containing protein [Afipia birgiae]|jgi:hypothetical protein|uniref:DUF1353 domain-containing protein n=1 Tax=Afipia birgiae TaxID=151414 RepID=UPI0002EE327C|nr:DUF1353 domain-containing protein [Afipia birgiae]